MTPEERSTTAPIPAPPATAPRRGGALVTMAIGGAIGLVAAQAIDAAMGGTDPAFAGGVGSVLGAALGRSGWIRVSAARGQGVNPLLALGVLLARIAGCAMIGFALFGPVAGALRVVAITGGALLLVTTAFSEHRWTTRPTTSSPGGAHGA